MRNRITVAATALAAALLSASLLAQEAPSEGSATPAGAEVLVLGVYHMSNPGRDLFNTQADDVLSPERQAQIAEVITVLEQFRPTKIAVEASFSSDTTAERYAAYVAGDRELTRNETEQLGFRLARRLGHETVYAVDVDGDFPFPRLTKFAKATGRDGELDAMMEAMGRQSDQENAYLASHTILEKLLRMNDDARVAEEVGTYFQLAKFSEPWDWAGADLVAAWFQRNMRIYSNIVQIVDAPDERVLVIYGAGHLGWLQYAFNNTPDFRLRTLAEFAR